MQTVETFIVIDAIGLHLLHRLVPSLPLLGAQNLLWIFQRGFGHRDHIECIRRGSGIEQFKGGDEEWA